MQHLRIQCKGRENVKSHIFVTNLVLRTTVWPRAQGNTHRYSDALLLYVSFVSESIFLIYIVTIRMLRAHLLFQL